MKSVIKKILKKIRDIIESLLRIKRFLKVNLIPDPEKEDEEFQGCYEMFEKEQIESCYKKFKENFLTSVFISTKKINNFALRRSLDNLQDIKKSPEPYFLEFGVFDGTSINKFASILKEKKIYGFDSFYGLREDWTGTAEFEKGYFNLDGKMPQVKNNVTLIKGWVQDTVNDFLKQNNPEICFAHMDLDTYESTKFVLSQIKPYLKKGSIILFNEFYNFPGWSVGEYKALNEVFNEKEYKIIAFSKHGWEAVIEII
jgi:hypothetical protein